MMNEKLLNENGYKKVVQFNRLRPVFYRYDSGIDEYLDEYGVEIRGIEIKRQEDIDKLQIRFNNLNKLWKESKDE